MPADLENRHAALARPFRVLALTATALALTLGAHSLGHGGAHAGGTSPLAMILLAAVVAPLVARASAGPARASRLLGTLGLAQLAGHLLLSVTSSAHGAVALSCRSVNHHGLACSTGPAPTGGHAHAMPAVAHDAAQASVQILPGAGMIAAHLLATLACATLVVRADRWIARAFAALVRLPRPVTVPVLARVPVVTVLASAHGRLVAVRVGARAPPLPA